MKSELLTKTTVCGVSVDQRSESIIRVSYTVSVAFVDSLILETKLNVPSLLIHVVVGRGGGNASYGQDYRRLAGNWGISTSVYFARERKGLPGFDA